VLTNILDQLPLTNDKIMIYDLDNLFENEAIIREIVQRGFQIIQYADSEIFRFIYESEMKDEKRNKEANNKYFVLVQRDAYVPYDILRHFYSKRISLRDLFPKLSHVVVKEVYANCMERLYNVYQNYEGEELGDDGTKNYLLNSVYGIYVEQIEDFMALVRHLVSIYYQGLSISPLICEYLIRQLSSQEKFFQYPLHKLISSPHSFFHFLQEQWSLYIKNIKGSTLKEGEILVDFNNHEIKVYMDNLFQEDFLHPIKVNEALDVPVWMEAGVIYDTTAGLKNIIGEKLNLIKNKLQNIKGYQDWFVISNLWSDVLVLYFKEKILEDFFRDEIHSFKEILWSQFKDWMLQEYNKLHSLSYIKSPVVVHKIPWHLESQIKQNGYKKVALMVMDGMSVDNWKVIKETMKSRFNCEENLTFAWVPTMTSFSRQAIFSGEIPVHFGDTIHSTNYDEKHWKKFWVESGFRDDSISYIRNVTTLQEKNLVNAIENRRLKILGIVVNAVDNFLHGAQLSLKEIHNSLRFWTENAGFAELIQKLLDRGYEIYIASDHGNIESIGIGKPREGLVVDTAGERVRVYSADFDSSNLMEGYNAYLWEGIGLLGQYHYFLCDKNYSFTKKNEKIMTHGGISLEEVIVPFIHIRKDD
jgi:hypothetical protein